MKLTSSLIRELDRLARDHGWSNTELARELGVHRSILVHARGGRRRLTSDTLSQIALRFGASPGIRDLVWNYLAVEHP
ncbi:MAG: helix-turn-helix domain-containing protein, partial [Thermoanaerobaculia bacterium]